MPPRRSFRPERCPPSGWLVGSVIDRTTGDGGPVRLRRPPLAVPPGRPSLRSELDPCPGTFGASLIVAAAFCALRRADRRARSTNRAFSPSSRAISKSSGCPLSSAMSRVSIRSLWPSTATMRRRSADSLRRGGSLGRSTSDQPQQRTPRPAVSMTGASSSDAWSPASRPPSSATPCEGCRIARRYFYDNAGRYWFSTQPSVNRLASDRAVQQSDDDVRVS